MKILVLISLFVNSIVLMAAPVKWITIDEDIYQKLKNSSDKSSLKLATLASENGVVVVKVTEDEIEKLSHFIHENFHRCGGFISHESKDEALSFLQPTADSYLAKSLSFTQYEIKNEMIVEPLVKSVQENKIRDLIIKLSNYNNRFYKSSTGVESSNFIAQTWKDLSKHRNDTKVELINHRSWPQPSVVMTIEGSDYPDEIIILGGHADSIAGMFGGGTSKAPGADDNASGISTITEVIRVLMENSIRPSRTLKFMAYAAEEVGLLGSKEIAASFKNERKTVLGVMQLDMTLNKGSKDLDIVLMSDFTNAPLNEFLGKLVDRYVKVAWGYSRCGYGCSDHASWHLNGFPASMPFESTMRDINKKIHTANDTLKTAGGDAFHSAKFAKLAIAYMVELGL